MKTVLIHSSCFLQILNFGYFNCSSSIICNVSRFTNLTEWVIFIIDNSSYVKYTLKCLKNLKFVKLNYVGKFQYVDMNSLINALPSVLKRSTMTNRSRTSPKSTMLNIGSVSFKIIYTYNLINIYLNINICSLYNFMLFYLKALDVFTGLNLTIQKFYFDAKNINYINSASLVQLHLDWLRPFTTTIHTVKQLTTTTETTITTS